jgi:hypothetical protein
MSSATISSSSHVSRLSSLLRPLGLCVYEEKINDLPDWVFNDDDGIRTLQDLYDTDIR